MARIGGRNSFMAWVVGLGCAAVVGTLVVLAVPAIPAGVQMIGDTLRAASTVPEAVDETRAPERPTSTPECRALYTEALWAELTQRSGGDPVQDASAPRTASASLVTGLTPAVRVTCVFTGINTGSIATTVADVDAGAAGIAEATLESAGYTCGPYGDGIRCRIVTAEGGEDQVVRDGIWLSSVYTGWEPDHYTERMAQQLWPS